MSDGPCCDRREHTAVHGRWFPDQEINGPSWSLSVECYAYFLFPLVIGWVWRRDGGLAALLCLVLMASSFALSDLPISDGWKALGGALPLFFVGAFTYRLFAEADFASLWQGDAMFLAVAGAIVAAFEFDVHEHVIVALFPLLLLVAAGNTGFATKVFNAAPLRWIGEISYSLYMGQIFAFSLAQPLAQMPLGHSLGLIGIRVATIAFAFATAVLMYRCIEVPCRALLRAAPDRLRHIAARA